METKTIKRDESYLKVMPELDPIDTEEIGINGVEVKVPAEYPLLEKSLLEEGGAREPIYTYKGIIIDGNNRFEICTRLNLNYKVVDLTDRFNNKLEAEYWAYQNQLARRNLRPYNRATIAAEMVKLQERIDKLLVEHDEAYAKEKKSRTPVDENLLNLANEGQVAETEKLPKNTNAEIAKLSGLSTAQITKKNKIEKERPDLAEKCEKGEMTIHEAHTILTNDKKPKKKDKPIHIEGNIVHDEQTVNDFSKDVLIKKSDVEKAADRVVMNLKVGVFSHLGRDESGKLLSTSFKAIRWDKFVDELVQEMLYIGVYIEIPEL